MATPTKWGGEFLINTTVAGSQSASAVCALADGRVVAVWTDDSGTGGDNSGTAVRGQILNADGSQSSAEFLINTTSTGSQGDPDIVALPNGGFAVVWTDGSQTGADTSGDAIRGQFFNPDGTKAGSELLINTTTAANQHNPSVATLADGRASIVWDNASGSAPYISSDAIRGQIFNPDGTKAGPELLINTLTELHQNNPSVVALADGRFATFWVQNTTETSPPPPLGASDTITDVVAQIFNADGTLFGGEFRVNSHITPIVTSSGPRTSRMLDPAAVLLDDGRFVVAWVGVATGRGGLMNSIFVNYEVVAQAFNPDGSMSGPEIVISQFQTQPGSTESTGFHHVDVAAVSGGRFALTWTSGVDSVGDVSGDLVYGQLFNADSSPSGSRFQVNTTSTGHQFQNAMSTLVDGRFLVSWTDASQSPNDTSGTAVRGQFFDPREAGVSFVGNALANQFYGTSFDDRIDGAGGADILGGGAGNDIFMVDNVADQVNENAGEGAADSIYAAVSGYTLAANVEIGYLLLPGGTLWAHDGGATLVGTNGNDSLFGGAAVDFFAGLGGDDRIDGGGAADHMTGGAGNDMYIVDNVADEVHEGAGEGAADSAYAAVSGYTLAANVEVGFLLQTGGTLRSHDGGATLFGTEGNDSLFGGAGIDAFAGQGGDDRLDGGGGGDHMTGGAGNDIYIVDDINDETTESAGEGADQAIVFTSNYVLRPNVEVGSVGTATGLMLSGGTGNNTLFGNAGDDLLFGGDGHDAFGAGGGNDTIDGGAGNDAMSGGDGDDLFVFRSGDGIDTIGDFIAGNASGDVARLLGYSATDFASLQPFMSQAGSDVFINFDASNQIMLSNVTLGQLNAGDFLFA